MSELNFEEREVWLCHLGVNVGHEQDGTGEDFLRPVIVLRKFGREMFWAIPLTSKKKEAVYYFQFSFEPDNLSVAILSQIRLIDFRRLKRKIGTMKKSDFAILKQKFRALMP